MDAHIHLYSVTTPGGPPWPSPEQKLLYRDVLPAEYAAVAKRNGIAGAIVVECNPMLEENYRVLELVAEDPLYWGLVGSLEMGAPDFVRNLDDLRKHERFIGIRAFLWSPTLTLERRQLEGLEALEASGLTLDIISRHRLNPKDKLDRLCKHVPRLRIVVDHLAGARGSHPAPEWELWMNRLAENPNLYIKVSSFFDVYNPKETENEPWQSPTDHRSYSPHFDVVMKAFGPDRLLFGSNWPVVTLGGDIETEIAIAEEYLRAHGQDVRDKIMYKTAAKLWRRVATDR